MKDEVRGRERREGESNKKKRRRRRIEREALWGRNRVRSCGGGGRREIKRILWMCRWVRGVCMVRGIWREKEEEKERRGVRGGEVILKHSPVGPSTSFVGV